MTSIIFAPYLVHTDLMALTKKTVKISLVSKPIKTRLKLTKNLFVFVFKSSLH